MKPEMALQQSTAQAGMDRRNNLSPAAAKDAAARVAATGALVGICQACWFFGGTAKNCNQLQRMKQIAHKYHMLLHIEAKKTAALEKKAIKKHVLHYMAVDIGKKQTSCQYWRGI